MATRKNPKNMTPKELEAAAGFNKSKLQAELSREQAESAQALISIVPKFMKAPIILASTHGAYDLRDEPSTWKVPANTYVFETQSIGDTTLTTIDDPIWRLCQSDSRSYFINYFLGNREFFTQPDIGPPQEQYSKIFKNVVFYKPGDTIATRDLSIGGGRKQEPSGIARESYVNMGFYKFNMEPTRTPAEDPPAPRKKREVRSEILLNLRTKMVEDEDFVITNEQFVNLIMKGTPIKYSGVKNGAKQLQPKQDFTFQVQREKYRIFIFSSCAVPNCNNLTGANGVTIENPYTSKLCNDRIKKIEAIQAAQNSKLQAMGIQTGPGGFDQQGVMGKLLIEARNLRIKAKGNVRLQAFAPGGTDAEEYAMLNDDVANWWELVGQTPEEKARSPAKKKPFNSIEARVRNATEKRGGQRRRKTRNNRQRKRW